MNSQVERGTVREIVHTIAFRAGVLERILRTPVLGSSEIRTDELAYVQLLQRQIDDLVRYLELPSAEPERKKGEWSNYKDEHSCSCCHSVVIQENWDDDNRYDFCPYCGADMRGDR